jgi:DUF971 family protein
MDTLQLAEDDLTVFKANQDLLRNKLKSATVEGQRPEQRFLVDHPRWGAQYGSLM